MALKLWSKAAAYRIAGKENNGVYIDAIKELENMDGFSHSQKFGNDVASL